MKSWHRNPIDIRVVEPQLRKVAIRDGGAEVVQLHDSWQTDAHALHVIPMFGAGCHLILWYNLPYVLFSKGRWTDIKYWKPLPRYDLLVHVEKEFSLAVGHLIGGKHYLWWVHQMPVPMVGIEAVVLTPVCNPILQTHPQPREILVMVDYNRLGLQTKRKFYVW